MTNKESIENLREFIDHFRTQIRQAEKVNDKAFDIERAKRDIQTFETAIKALEFFSKAEVVISQLRADRDSLLAEQSEDAVSREAVLDGIGGMFCEEWVKTLFKTMVKQLPPVQPKRQTGHWILSEDGLYRPICDKCGAHPWKGYIPTVEEATEIFKFCPNCGVDMRVKAESEDKE